jgi:hypothetical protein
MRVKVCSQFWPGGPQDRTEGPRQGTTIHGGIDLNRGVKRASSATLEPVVLVYSLLFFPFPDPSKLIPAPRAPPPASFPPPVAYCPLPCFF